jgi:FHA domain
MRCTMATDDLNVSRLVVSEPAEQVGLVLSFSRPEMVIGNSDTADLFLERQFVSRRHALVTVDSSGLVTIRDLNSTGGTFVNDERLAGPRALRPGDVVRFADLVARFEPGSSPGIPMAAADSPTQILPLHTGANAPPRSDTERTESSGAGRQRPRAKTPDGKDPAPSEEKTPAGNTEPQPHRVRMPGFVKDEDIGLGDVIKRVTYAAGIKPCAGCEKRAAALNRWVHFSR